MTEQDYYGQIKRVLQKVDNAKDGTRDFHAVVLMWNKGKENALHWIHGNPESIMALLFAAMKVSDDFAYYVANAIEARYNELKEEKNNKNQIPNDNEENHI